jgi:hypothetical protein
MKSSREEKRFSREKMKSSREEMKSSREEKTFTREKTKSSRENVSFPYTKTAFSDKIGTKTGVKIVFRTVPVAFSPALSENSSFSFTNWVVHPVFSCPPKGGQVGSYAFSPQKTTLNLGFLIINLYLNAGR